MKNIILILVALLFVTIGCKDKIVKEPKSLIDKEVMIDIIYDLSVLEAMKAQTMGVQTTYPKATVFLKNKYKIDSLTFAQNTQYYAQDIKEYKKMYEKVKERLKEESIKVDGKTQEKPADDVGIVK